MGRFKLALPWGTGTVIGQVIATLDAAGLTDILVVTGYRAAAVNAILGSTRARTVFNPQYATGEMLSSLQAGLRAIDVLPHQGGSDRPRAALLCLGDQPQMTVATVQAVLASAAEDGWSQIVIPSHRMRAGHPIVLPRWLWPEILGCSSTLRQLLARQRERTRYLVVDTPTILADLDTPEDYEGRGSELAP